MNRILNSTKLLENKFPLIIVILVYVIFKFLFFNTGMFWDSITILSKPATFLFENGIFNFNYPPTFDNGDPQLVTFYIALIWKIFGRTLFITHLAFLPIVILILLQLYQLTTKLFDVKIAPYVFLLITLDPTLMSQSLGLYQDSFLILFSIFIINALLEKNNLKTMIFMVLLCFVSRRGMLLTFGFMLANYINLRFIEKRSFFKTLKQIFLNYLPAVTFVFLFIAWRLHTYNWFFTTNQTSTGELVNLSGLIKNIFVLIRWFIDNGRIFLWLIFVILILKLKEKTSFFSQNIFILVIFLSISLVMMCVTLPLANPFGARYFVVHYFIFAILFSKLLTSIVKEKTAKRMLIIMSVLLFSGNYWIYPEKLAQSWDSSLAQLSYCKIRNQTISFFEKNHIDLQTVGVGFPMNEKFNYTDIETDKRSFESIDFKRNKWLVYSNIFNFTDQNIEKSKSWILIDEFHQGNVFMKIYKNPSFKSIP